MAGKIGKIGAFSHFRYHFNSIILDAFV